MKQHILEKSFIKVPLLINWVQFLFEKRTEPYKRYGEGSIAEENSASAIRGWRSGGLRPSAGQLVKVL